jgi:hypothetical protein
VDLWWWRGALFVDGKTPIAAAGMRCVECTSELLRCRQPCACDPYRAGTALPLVHATFRSPNLKTRLASAREEFRAVW